MRVTPAAAQPDVVRDGPIQPHPQLLENSRGCDVRRVTRRPDDTHRELVEREADRVTSRGGGDATTPDVGVDRVADLGDPGRGVDDGELDHSDDTAGSDDAEDMSSLRHLLRGLDQAARVAADEDIARLFVLGVGMRTHTGVARRMFGALAQRGINISMINTSEVRVSVVVDRARGEEALAALKQAFNVA